MVFVRGKDKRYCGSTQGRKGVGEGHPPVAFLGSSRRSRSHEAELAVDSGILRL